LESVGEEIDDDNRFGSAKAAYPQLMEAFQSNQSEVCKRINLLEKSTERLKSQIADFCSGNVSLSINGQFMTPSR
jgi:hypothetical protein